MNVLSLTLLCAYDALQGPFCQTGEADVQDYVCARAERFIFKDVLRTIYYHCYKGAVLQTRLVCLPIVRYKFEAVVLGILIYKNVDVFLPYYSAYKPYYIFGRDTDKIQFADDLTLLYSSRTFQFFCKFM